MKLQPELRIRWVFEIHSSEAWLTEQRSVAFLFLAGNVRHLVQSLRRKATGSLKIVHEKYSLKAKNPEETKRYLEEFVDAISHNDAMGGHLDKVCAVRRDALDVKPFAAMLWPGQAVLSVLRGGTCGSCKPHVRYPGLCCADYTYCVVYPIWDNCC